MMSEDAETELNTNLTELCEELSSAGDPDTRTLPERKRFQIEVSYKTRGGNKRSRSGEVWAATDEHPGKIRFSENAGEPGEDPYYVTWRGREPVLMSVSDTGRESILGPVVEYETTGRGSPEIRADGGEELETLATAVSDTLGQSTIGMSRVMISVGDVEGDVTIQANGHTDRGTWEDLRDDITSTLAANGFRYTAKDQWAFVRVDGREVRADGSGRPTTTEDTPCPREVWRAAAVDGRRITVTVQPRDGSPLTFRGDITSRRKTGSHANTYVTITFIPDGELAPVEIEAAKERGEWSPFRAFHWTLPERASGPDEHVFQYVGEVSALDVNGARERGEVNGEGVA